MLPVLPTRERKLAMCRSRRNGVSWVELGRDYGLSAQRARQIVARLERLAESDLGLLHIPTRIRNALLRAGYRSPPELAAADDADLLHIPNFGPKALAKVRRALAAHTGRE